MNGKNIFYAKIILFGEYGIIFDSMALTIPFTHFHGELIFSDPYKYTDLDLANESNSQLKEYAAYLRKLQIENKTECQINVDSFEKDIEKGLYFESSIPHSYGLGSSGALVAAVYDSYSNSKINSSRSLKPSEMLKLKSVFALQESFFHGRSSGIDPLNAYIKFALLIKNKDVITSITIPRNRDEGDGAIFLVNTGGPGRTEPLVHLFLEKCKLEKYNNVITNEYIPLTNRCITSLVGGDLHDFFDSLRQLSDVQLQYMNPMIPYHFQEHWKNGLDTDDYTLKLCGSGGGGYILGFTKKFEKARKYFKEKNIELITVYRSAR